MTFRQVTFDKIRAPPYLSRNEEIVYQTEDNIIATKYSKLLAKHKYFRAKIYSNWPQSGLIMEARVSLTTGQKILIITTIKGPSQTLEVKSYEEDYYLPIDLDANFYTQLIETDNNKNIIIRERILGINNNSKIIPFYIVVL